MENPAKIQKSPTWEIAPALQERVDRRKMPRSQPSPGGPLPPEPPLSPSVSPASADRGRKKSGSGHRRRGSWSLVSESFTYIARGAIYLVTDKLRDIRIKFGFVVEGREREEPCRNQNSRRQRLTG